jgi:hypothetical protein
MVLLGLGTVLLDGNNVCWLLDFGIHVVVVCVAFGLQWRRRSTSVVWLGSWMMIRACFIWCHLLVRLIFFNWSHEWLVCSEWDLWASTISYLVAANRWGAVQFETDFACIDFAQCIFYRLHGQTWSMTWYDWSHVLTAVVRDCMSVLERDCTSAPGRDWRHFLSCPVWHNIYV